VSTGEAIVPVDGSIKRLVFLIFVVFLDALGIGLIRPVIPSYIETVIGASGSQVSLFFGIAATAYLTAMFLGGPIAGKLSDCFGRRPILLLALLGSGLSYFICAVTRSGGVLIATQIAAGACGSTVAIASASALDFCPIKSRAQTLGLLWAAFGIGVTIGPAIGGLVGKSSPILPFKLAGCLAMANMLYGYFVLPESLPLEKRMSWTRTGLNPVTAIADVIRQNSQRWIVPAFVLLVCANGAGEAVSLLFPRLQFGWSVGAIGLLATSYAAATAVGQAVLAPLLIRRIGEQRTVYSGLVAKVAGFALLAFVFRGWQMYVVIPFAVLAGAVLPTMISKLSSDVPAEMQGELQGAIASLSVLSSAIGILAVTVVFSAFTSNHSPAYFPGSGYVLTAALAIASLCSIRWNMRAVRLAERHVS
jgi:MFS transporter, DHA1 family, tetracycline resistance protein